MFVLAIDYEVVIQGVREKYSGDIPLSKCRSVFDKIIQQSFQMPVESYDLYGLVEKHLGSVIDNKYRKDLSALWGVPLEKIHAPSRECSIPIC